MRRSIISAIFVIVAGSFLHFAWELSGRSSLVSLVAATNESTWEHLKLAFWPALALTPVQRWLYGSLAGWLPATAVRCVLPSFLIVGLFYGYTAVLGRHHLVADLAIFAVSILAGEIGGHALLAREFGAKSRAGALALLIIAVLALSSFTFRPPDVFLFRPPTVPGPEAP